MRTYWLFAIFVQIVCIIYYLSKLVEILQQIADKL